MKRRIPSTIALSLFESAARHESFARAAAEMYLTESAVSRQIATLEGYLGVKLFSRVRKQVVLTDAGRAYSRSIRPSLDEIELHTTSLIESRGRTGILELAVIPTFASRWLLPRLQTFLAAHPGITINMTEKPDPFEFRGTNLDVALHFDDPAWTDAAKFQLFEEELVPALNPRYLDASKLSTPDTLSLLPLLQKRSRPDAWNRWFAAAGVQDINIHTTMRFDLYAMVIDAARAGLGVGLVPRFYVQDDMDAGDLMIPFAQTLKHEKRYCVVCPQEKLELPQVQAFIAWARDTARDFIK
jgi:LysR family glycine cleavage system transcriptional activator